MSLLLFALSMIFGALLFVKLIGPDAWLIRGLRGDKIGAVLAFCTIIPCGILIFLLLRFSLSLLPGLITGTSPAAAADTNSTTEYAEKVQVCHIAVCLMSFCVPIVTGYLLSLLYRAVYGIVRRLAFR